MSEREKTRRGQALPARLPLFPLPGALLLPGGQLPLNIFEPRYLRMVDEALAGARVIGMVQPRAGALFGDPPLYAVGCAGRIISFVETDDGRYLITLSGCRRFRIIEEHESETPYREAAINWSAFPVDAGEDLSVERVDRRRLIAALRRYLDAEGLKTDWKIVGEAPTEALVASLAMGCPFEPNEKQALLEAETVADRADCLIALMEMSCAGENNGEEPLQ